MLHIQAWLKMQDHLSLNSFSLASVFAKKPGNLHVSSVAKVSRAMMRIPSLANVVRLSDVKCLTVSSPLVAERSLSAKIIHSIIASTRLAVCWYAWLRFVRLRFALLRSVLLRSARLRSARLRFAWLRFTRMRPAPDRRRAGAGRDGSSLGQGQGTRGARYRRDRFRSPGWQRAGLRAEKTSSHSPSPPCHTRRCFMNSRTLSLATRLSLTSMIPTRRRVPCAKWKPKRSRCSCASRLN